MSRLRIADEILKETNQIRLRMDGLFSVKPRSVFPKGATKDEIRQLYREKAKALHPDLGGTHADMVRLNKDFEEAMKRG